MCAPGWRRGGPDELSLHEFFFYPRPSSVAAPGDCPLLFSPPIPRRGKAGIVLMQQQ